MQTETLCRHHTRWAAHCTAHSQAPVSAGYNPHATQHICEPSPLKVGLADHVALALPASQPTHQVMLESSTLTAPRLRCTLQAHALLTGSCGTATSRREPPDSCY